MATESWAAALLLFLTVWFVIGCIVVAVGWVEDVAARRRPRLLPVGVRT